MNFKNDIPLSLAIAAHRGTSWVPEQRGTYVVSSYEAELAEVYETLKAQAVKGGTLDKLDDEFARFRGGYKAKNLAYLQSKSRCISSFIAGPSNFPVRRAEKRSDIAMRRLNELCEFKARAMKAAIRNLRPDLRPIMAGDADAIERLEQNIRDADRAQERMKTANAAIRKNAKKGAEAQIAALVEQGFSDGRAVELIKPDCLGRIGFPDYALTNNNANIRRMKQRVEQITKAQAMPDTAISGANGITLEDCPAENRVRLTFPGKPAEEIRTKLKKNGFRWTPSLGLWQAYRNNSSLALAQQMASGKEFA